MFKRPDGHNTRPPPRIAFANHALGSDRYYARFIPALAERATTMTPTVMMTMMMMMSAGTGAATKTPID